MRIELSEKNLLENKEMDFKNGIVNIQAAGYNGTRTVYSLILIFFPRLQLIHRLRFI